MDNRFAIAVNDELLKENDALRLLCRELTDRLNETKAQLNVLIEKMDDLDAWDVYDKSQAETTNN